MLPLQNGVVTRRTNPPEIPLVDEYLRYVVSAEVPSNHAFPGLLQDIRELATAGPPVDLGVDAGFAKFLVGRGATRIVLNRVYHGIEVREGLVSGFTLGRESPRLITGRPPAPSSFLRTIVGSKPLLISLLLAYRLV